MNAQALMVLIIKTSIVLIVFAIGLLASPKDAMYVLTRPGLLARSLFSMSVFMPALALALDVAFRLKAPVEIALLAMAMSPVPPFMPTKARKQGGRQDYAVGLLVASALFAVVLIPSFLGLLGTLSGAPLSLPAMAILKVMIISVFAPLAVGIAIHSLYPAFSVKAAAIVEKTALALLAVGLLALLFGMFRPMLSLVGDGTLAAFAVFSAAGLAIGHMLGGPERESRMDLAFCTATRHPGVALALALANAPNQPLIPAAILLYMIVSIVAAGVYTGWTKRHGAAEAREKPVVRKKPGTEGLRPA